ncbi:MAG: sulfatase-like hydrolase/transferase [Christensenellales bacterium]|jgi:choline-sulfatase
MRKPNIVFILADDQGAWAMRCAGTPELYTPSLDRIAAEGMRFENFFCASPVCSPARASLLTGRMPSAHGVLDWLRSGNVDAQKFAAQGRENPYGGYADETEPIAYLQGTPTYTDMLRENGYTCALSGKWHLGDSLQPQCGFSSWYTIGKGGCFYYHPDIVENGEITVRHGEYVTDLITQRACSDIVRLSAKDTPFYLSVHYTAPHSPWEAEQHPQKWIDYYADCKFESIPDVPDHPHLTVDPVYGTPRRLENLRGYFAAISAMDEGIGKIIQTLEAQGILDDTLLIFTGDNGMNMGHHGIWGKGNGTFPLNMFDTSVKVPFLIRYPAEIAKPGTVSSAMVSAYDLFPTIAEIVGGSCPNDLPGASFLPALRGGASTREEVVVFDEYGPVRMIRTDEWKYIHHYPYGGNELYRISEDPAEEHNLIGSAAYAETVLDLRLRLERFFVRYSDPKTDGAREGVTGFGQLCRPGIYATRPDVYASIPHREGT